MHEFLSLRHAIQVVDVRSPLEFEQGHIPGAKNIPLLNNEERIAVGTDYKQKGQAAAIRTGFRLVGRRLEEIVSETDKISNGKELLIYCWRGGMRSKNFCEFLKMAQIKSRALIGGYKTYRRFALETFKKPFSIILLGGCTGSGKTDILRALQIHGEQILDLEKFACHKGSAFGGLMMPPQPTVEQFQNELFEEILTLDCTRRIWIEDESILIGHVVLPSDFWETMRKSKIVKMDVSKTIRAKRLAHEYGEAGKELLLQSMSKIVKKLGGQHFKEAKERLMQNDSVGASEIVLTYYDKTYLKNLEARKHRILFTHSWDGIDASAVADELIKKVSSW